MKTRTGLLLGLACCLCLTGCIAPPPPAQAEDGTEWSEDWVTVGGIVGIDTPDGLDPRENNEALAVNGMYYATWSAGEAVPYVNEDGDDAQLYDAQIYLLLAGYSEAERAEETAAQWLELAQDQYAVETAETMTCSGRDFTVITYTYSSDANPYDRGASAFGVYRNYAISVELSCQDSFEGDPLETLTGFLERCHYAVS